MFNMNETIATQKFIAQKCTLFPRMHAQGGEVIGHAIVVIVAIK